MQVFWSIVFVVLSMATLGCVVKIAIPKPESRKRLVQTTRWLGEQIIDLAVGWAIVGVFLTIIIAALAVLFIPGLIVFLIYWVIPQDQGCTTPLPEAPGNTLFDDVYNINKHG